MLDFNQNNDVIQSIFGFLSQEVGFALRLTCKSFNITATSNHIIMPFLTRLKAIDCKVSVLPPTGKVNESWCYERFISEFARIANIHAREIKSILQVQHKFTKEEIKKELVLLKTFDESVDMLKIQLSTLERQHHALEFINTTQIKPRIKLDSDELDIHSLLITRIPESLFTNPEYQNYWKKVKIIFCSLNNLHTLPEFVGNCQALERLTFFYNHVQTFPESLEHCLALQRLDCSYNQINALPENLGHCLALQELYCSYNEITTLPESLEYCQALQQINCTNNKLQALPESLSNCQSLKKLHCGNNNLTDIPKAIINKLGVDWYEKTMTDQKKRPTSSLQDITQSSPLPPKLKDENKLKADEIKLDNNQDDKAESIKRNWLINITTVIISLALSSFIFALSGCVTLIAALLLKTGIALAPTKAAFAAISLVSGVIATTTLFGLYQLGVALKTAVIRYGQSQKQRINANNTLFDKQLAQLVTQFSVNTTQSFVKP
ncbi:MAG: leucine-rich repeat domain-containing protein, partial [Proteobacteria bacterium]|nr:leucine-rich repeat domain-containing protein [Pseudomonadota bacterium]